MKNKNFKALNLEEARRFLQCFFEREDFSKENLRGKERKENLKKEKKGAKRGEVNLRIFSDRKGTGFKGKNLSLNLEDFSYKSKVLKAHNEAYRGIFFVVNSGGNSDRSITRINAQFFECDTLSFKEQWENIKKFPLEPSLVVKTKKSLHVYFLIKDGQVSRFRTIQRKLAKHFKGDFSCINESRVMRVPGFYHCKGEPVVVRCVKFNPELLYTQEELERALSLIKEENLEKKENIKENNPHKEKNEGNNKDFLNLGYKKELFREDTDSFKNLRENIKKQRNKPLENYKEDIREKNRQKRKIELKKESESKALDKPLEEEFLEDEFSEEEFSEEDYSSEEEFSSQKEFSLGEKFSKEDFEEEILEEEDLVREDLRGEKKEPIFRERGLDLVCFKCDFIRHCKSNSKNLSEPLWHGMITNLALFKGGRKRIHELSRDYEGYSKEETDLKIKNFLRSGAGPMTCKSLIERGYPCKSYGKLCYGKSPASLSFKPLGVKDIREAIKLLRFSDFSMATNVDTALKFIENYMYNMGLPLGKSLIEEELSTHLKLKNSKDLVAFYKELIRDLKREKRDKNKDNTKSKQKKSEGIPWYEQQEKGFKFLPFVLAKHLKESRNIYYGGESFLIYKEGVYDISGEKEAGKIIMEYMLPNYCTMSSLRDCREQWEIMISVDFESFNKNPYVVNLKNGLLDIRDWEFKEHTPTYLSTVQLNVRYNPKADCPQFKGFLREVLDFRLIPLVQEIVGYLLTSNTSAQKAFVFLGPARTGKSTLLWVIEYLLLGRKNVSNIPWQDIGEKFKTAELLGKLANIFSDLPSKAIEDTGIFKVVTGEDYLMAEKKNKNPFKFKPFSRLVFSCNELPRNYVDRTEGFYRRIIIVPFTKQIQREKIDKNLKYKFKGEKEGILNWALEGLKRLYENNFEFSENELTYEVKRDYKRENNNVLAFIEECCEVREEYSCSRNELYEAYKDFCDETGLKALSQIKFNKEVEGNFNIERNRTGQLRVWNGVRIKVFDLVK